MAPHQSCLLQLLQLKLYKQITPWLSPCYSSVVFYTRLSPSRPMVYVTFHINNGQYGQSLNPITASQKHAILQGKCHFHYQQITTIISACLLSTNSLPI